jgi:thiol:disulfide interchange protein DsbD
MTNFCNSQERFQTDKPRIVQLNLKRFWKCIFAFTLFISVNSLSYAQSAQTALSEIELISEYSVLPKEGGTITLAFRLNPQAGWHSYWVNPGAVGKAVRAKWTPLDGVKFGNFRFPVPHPIPSSGIISYGYDKEIKLLMDVDIAPNLTGNMTFKGKFSWLVCDDKSCVPERSSLSITLPVGTKTLDPAKKHLFTMARATQPQKVDWSSKLSISKEQVDVVTLLPFDGSKIKEAYLFAVERRMVDYNSPQEWNVDGKKLSFSLKAHKKAFGKENLNYLLTLNLQDGSEEAYLLYANVNGSGVIPASTTSQIGPSSPTAGNDGTPRADNGPDSMSLWKALIFAFLGGIILNLMPCVLPILSMKALSLVKMSGKKLSEARMSGLFYSLGILTTFALIGGFLLFARYGGQAIGWGFHLQSPMVNLVLGLLVMIIGMNLLGVFEFTGRFAGKGQSLVRGGENRSSFFAGLLAVIVATPCTAPFMAAALGYALVQPALIAMLIFLTLGLGLALPYLILTFFPAFRHLLPKPGAWMETMRNILAFPMLATGIWLFWVMGQQAGTNVMGVAYASALFLSFGLWSLGKLQTGKHIRRWGLMSVMAIIAAVYLGYQIKDMHKPSKYNSQAAYLGSLPLEHFTEDLVKKYLKEGQPFFLYFTADWCVSCKVNERIALKTDAVAEAFKQHNIKVIEGNWTNQDPVITKFLQKYGRIGVPLYLYFSKGSSLSSPIILPQILTADIVIEALVPVPVI